MAPPARSAYTLTDDAFAALETATTRYAREYMSRFDPSHDTAHIARVSSLARHLLAAHPPAASLDQRIVVLAALLHDVGDKKYTADGPAESAEAVLREAGAPAALASAVQTVVSHVSYSGEIKDPAAVRTVLDVFPELAVVQDADRLDALGAVGVGRAFVFGGVKRPQDGMDGAVRHFGEKLERLEDMMKTDEGRRMARVRTERIKLFGQWWREEVELAAR